MGFTLQSDGLAHQVRVPTEGPGPEIMAEDGHGGTTRNVLGGLELPTDLGQDPKGPEVPGSHPLLLDESAGCICGEVHPSHPARVDGPLELPPLVSD